MRFLPKSHERRIALGATAGDAIQHCFNNLLDPLGSGHCCCCLRECHTATNAIIREK